MIYLYKKHKAKKARAAEQQQSSEPLGDSVQAETAQKDEKALTSEPDISGEGTTPVKVADKESTVETAAEKRARRIYRWKLVIGLFPPAFLAAVDTTIVATALTTISSHFSMSICNFSFTY